MMYNWNGEEDWTGGDKISEFLSLGIPVTHFIIAYSPHPYLFISIANYFLSGKFIKFGRKLTEATTILDIYF